MRVQHLETVIIALKLQGSEVQTFNKMPELDRKELHVCSSSNWISVQDAHSLKPLMREVLYRNSLKRSMMAHGLIVGCICNI